MSSTYERIYAVANRIPKGRVTTYGQIARLAGIPGQARQVGYALSALSDDQRVAWHRVINSKGQISMRSEASFEKLQRALLEGEGVVFGPNARVSLVRFLWQPEVEANRVRSRECHSVVEWPSAGEEPTCTRSSRLAIWRSGRARCCSGCSAPGSRRGPGS